MPPWPARLACPPSLTAGPLPRFYDACTAARRGVAQLARAPVSKTGGCGFDPLRPCQSLSGGLWGKVMALGVADPIKFLRDVRAEVARVTWPSRKETLVTTGLVFALSALAALFFFVADQVIGIGVRAMFGVGH